MNNREITYDCPYCGAEVMTSLSMSSDQLASLNVVFLGCPYCQMFSVTMPCYLTDGNLIDKIPVSRCHKADDGSMVIEDREMSQQLYLEYARGHGIIPEQRDGPISLTPLDIDCPTTPISGQEARQFKWDLEHLLDHRYFDSSGEVHRIKLSDL